MPGLWILRREAPRRRGPRMARGPLANSHPMVRRAEGPGCCNIRGRVGLQLSWKSACMACSER
jgi:hypothetical protein